MTQTHERSGYNMTDMIDDLQNENQSSAEKIFAVALGQILQNNQGIIIHFKREGEETVGCAIVRLYDEEIDRWHIKVVMNESFLESTHGEVFLLQTTSGPIVSEEPSTEAQVYH